MKGQWFLKFLQSLSTTGLILGTLFFIASLTPTLIPRTYLTQGVLSGACFAVGYGLGELCRRLWVYLELPLASVRVARVSNIVAGTLCVIGGIWCLWRTTYWQNSIRVLMGLEPLTSANPFKICAIAAVTFLILLMLGVFFEFIHRSVSAKVNPIIPRRISNVVGIAVAVVLFWSIANGVIFRFTLHVLELSFQQRDALFEPETAKPVSPSKTGGAASLLRWDQLGRTGRAFIAGGPTAADISAFTKKDALEPIRVYVGLRSADTPEARARLALEELKRVKAFDRSVLVVITPTGTGWVDPSAMNSVEYLQGGDIASVAMQYSYLNSPLSLIVEPEYGAAAARALFVEVYRYWTALPKDKRPRLYLHGLSLGSMNSEKSVELFEMIGDPINGALWSGPPFENKIWRSVTNGRNAGSPAWLPQFRDGSVVRFTSQNGFTVPPQTPWGPMRIVYLQYASDAITFFDYHDFYREPAWMKSPRGPDVSPELRWYPVVTMLQLALDMAVATSTPMGYGHVYAPSHYIDAWIAVMNIQGWSAAGIARLKQHLWPGQTQNSPGSHEAYEDRGG